MTGRQSWTWLQSVGLTVEGPGAGVPGWVREAGLSGDAIALYGVLLHAGEAGGGRMVDADSLAAHLHQVVSHHTVFAVGCAMAELVGAGVVEVGCRPGTGDGGPEFTCYLRTTSPTGHQPRQDQAGLSGMEAALDASDGLRPVLQAQAREELTAEGAPLTRAAVVRRAHVLLQERRTPGREAAQPERDHDSDRRGDDRGGPGRRGWGVAS